MKAYKKLVGGKLREFRVRKGLKAYEVAEMIGLSAGSYRNMESGSQLPAVYHLEILLKLFNCRTDELLWDAGWEKLVEDPKKIMDEYIAPMEKEITLRKNKKRMEIEQNILKSVLLEVDDYRDSEFISFAVGEDFLDILESVRTEIEIRVKQLYKRHLREKNPQNWKVEIAPNGTVYKSKNI